MVHFEGLTADRGSASESTANSREGRLEGKRIIVTGGAAGAGAASVRRFAAEGARVAVLDVQDERGELLATELAYKGYRVSFRHFDAGAVDDVESVVASAVDTLGGVDGLFNHAGRLLVRSLVETTLREWNDLMAVNVTAMFLSCRTVLPTMVAAGSGTIVNTSSISGLTASAFEAAYCVSKAAVVQLTRAVAVEYRDRGIRCNALCPGFIRTDHGTREMRELESLDGSDVLHDIESRQHRLCEPDEVAGAALALFCDDMSFVNGAALVVDNGWLAMT